MKYRYFSINCYSTVNVTCTCSYKHVHTLTIAPSGTPKWLTVRCSLPTSVWLSWGDVPEDQQNGEITGYSIQVEGRNTTRNVQTTRGYFTLAVYTSEEISDLRPSTEYIFSVSAETTVGSGPAISVSFITPQEVEASVHTLMTWCGGVLTIILIVHAIFYFFTST